MTQSKTTADAVLKDSKSSVGSLTRAIDGLVREYVETGRDDIVAQASQLSRRREDLLKPMIIRTGRIKKAS